MCIATSGSTNVLLSPQHIVSCAGGYVWTGSTGCDGGWPAYVFSFTKDYGCTSCTSRCTAGCEKYVSGDGHTIPSCRTSGTCPSSSSSLTLNKWGYSSAGTFAAGTPISTIQQYLMSYGPISASFMVTQAFYNFFNSNPTGVFKTTCPSSWNDPLSLGGHAVILIGWGTASDGTDYWLLQNSWGTSWGDHGIFRMKRGVNLCFIESYLATVVGSTKLNRDVDPEIAQYLLPDSQVSMPPYLPGSPISVDSDSDGIKGILNWFTTQIHLDDNEIVKQVFPQSATVQVVNGINFNIKFEGIGSLSNRFQMNALINRSPDGTLTLLDHKIDLIPVAVGLFGLFGFGTLILVIAAPIVVISLAAGILIIRRRSRQLKQHKAADIAEVSLQQEFLMAQTNEQEEL